MNVDIAALRAIERDKDIPFEVVLEAIETALLTAYKHTEGHHAHQCEAPPVAETHLISYKSMVRAADRPLRRP